MFVVLLLLLCQPCYIFANLNSLYGRNNPHLFGRSNYFPPHQNVYTPPPPTSQPGTTPEKATVNPGDERLADEYGLKVPFGDCIISWDSFQDHVVGRNWIQVYEIDDDEEILPSISTKGHLHWNLINDTLIRRDASLRVNSPDRCLYWWGIDMRARHELAVFRPVSGNAIVIPERVDYVVSSDPSKYIIYFFCFEPKRDDRCPVAKLLLLIKDEREWNLGGNGVPEGQIKLNDIPWGEIEATMIKCFNKKFKDAIHPQLKWSWRGEECAVPRSDVHNAVIGNV